jgi:type II secretory pathway pseudopilin PulG
MATLQNNSKPVNQRFGLKHHPVPVTRQLQKASASGVTLLELALGLMIIAVLSVAVSSLVRTGVEHQMSQRTHDMMQTIAMNMIDDLRFDTRTAVSATIGNGGNQLTLTPGNNAAVIDYVLAGGNFQRRQGGNTKDYNTNITPPLEVACLAANGNATGCFEGYIPDASTPGGMIRNDATPRQIRTNNITVRQINNGTSLIDQNFGRSNFALHNFAFNLMSSTEFR